MSGLVVIFVFAFILNGPLLFGDAKEGNRRVNSIRTFEANRNVLTFPREIDVGQMLVIPQLIASEFDKIGAGSIFPSSMFEKVVSIGRRHISTDDRKVKQDGRYVVRQGDTLWRVAAKQLGDGSRYKEISKLNADVLEDEDNLTIGMRLNLPAQ